MKSLFAVLLVLLCANLKAAANAGETARNGGAEVQINLCSEPRQIIAALHLERKGSKSQEVWYVDTFGLDLFRQGVMFRLRIKDRKSELTLKVANQDCARVNADLLPADQAKCEYDVRGAQSVGAVSVTRILDDGQVRGLIEGRLALADLLSQAQIRYLKEVVTLWPLVPGLKSLGPARVETYHKKGQSFVVELWQLPSGRHYEEISQKSSLKDAPRVNAALEGILSRNQVQLCPDQGSQTGSRLREFLNLTPR
jgi:hypothetical protein